MAPPQRFLPTALPIAVRLPDPRPQPPPLPGQRNLDQLNQGDPFRRGRLAEYDTSEGAPVDAWVTKVSTRVLRSMYKPYPDLPNGKPSATGDWYVEFLDGALIVYRQTPRDVWTDFYNSMSWGQFITYRCADVGRPYDTLRGPQRKVSAKQRKIRDVTRNEGRPR